MKVIEHLVNGEIVSMGDPTQDVFNPSTGEVSKQVSLATKTTVEKAIAAAHDAFPEWRATPPLKRARIMFRFKELLEKNVDEIAQILGITSLRYLDYKTMSSMFDDKVCGCCFTGEYDKELIDF